MRDFNRFDVRGVPTVIIVFDTNVWISDLALTSGVGSAVRFYLREQRARIGLPKVIKLEAEVHMRTTLNEHIEKIRSSHGQLLAVFGRLEKWYCQLSKMLKNWFPSYFQLLE